MGGAGEGGEQPTVLPGPGADGRAQRPPLGAVALVTAGLDAGALHELGPVTIVGREGDLRMGDPGVSRQHLSLQRGSAGISVRDLGSRGGTALNGVPITEVSVLHPGDRLGLGASELVLLQPVSASSGTSPWSIEVRCGASVTHVALLDRVRIGRDPLADVPIADPRISARHLTLAVGRDGGIEVVEERSTNGTTLDGRPVREGDHLRDGDVLELGPGLVTVTVRRTHAGAAAVDVRVAFAAQEHAPATVVVDAGPDELIGAVAAALAAEVEAGLGRATDRVTIARLRDGLLFQPDDRWANVRARRGDELRLVRLSPTWCDRLRSATAPAPVGPVASVTSLPRSVSPPVAHRFQRPNPPESASLRGRGVGWQVAGGIATASVGLLIALVRPAYALFGLIAGVAGISAMAAGVMADRSRRVHRLRSFREQIASLDAELGQVRRAQSASWHAQSPGLAELDAWVRGLDSRLWERRADDSDALLLRVGTGTRAALLDGGVGYQSDSPHAPEVEATIERHRLVPSVPVCVGGPRAGSVGLAGPPSVTDPVVTRMVVEAACLHPPSDLQIWILDPSPDWGFARWLPHATGERGDRVARDQAHAEDLTAELAATMLAEARIDRRTGPEVLHLVVARAETRPRLVDELVERMPGAGLMIITARDARGMPPGLGQLVQVERSDEAVMRGEVADGAVGSFRLDAASSSQAEAIALLLAPLRAGSDRAAPPVPRSVVALNGVDRRGPLDLEEVWASCDQPMAATMAVGPDGAAVSFALREHGPHGVIAGITGSGKSEFLLSLLAALAITHSPDDLNLFLIDYKGGATFAPVAALPHVAGMVTDLERDGDLVGRAFTALDAEIDHRKELLAATGVADIIRYRMLEHPPEPMPNLLVVIDEFAELVKQREEIRSRLDTVVTQGRSLGIHLLLACQSPTGAISHAIRTNTNLWICLRVGRDDESREMLGRVDAARLRDDERGAGYVRRGASEEITRFNAVRSTVPVGLTSGAVRVHRPGQAPVGGVPGRPPTSGGRMPVGVEVAGAGSSPTELDQVVEAALAATAAGAASPARALWLPPLPEELAAHDVVAQRPPDRLVALLGLVDRPAQQRQDPYLVDLTAKGNALVCGQLGFGKSSALCQLAVDLATQHGPADLHLYGLESGAGSLAALTALPQTAAVVAAEDTDRVTRLLGRLHRTMSERRERLAALGGGGFEQLRHEDGSPWIVLLIDDVISLRGAGDLLGPDSATDMINPILQGGPSVGIHVVVSMAQSMELRLSQLNLIPERIMVRAAEPADYQLVNMRVRSSDLPQGPPGRAHIAGGAEVQLIRCGPDDLAAATARWAGVPGGPPPVARLAREVGLDLSRLHDPGSILLGVGGPELAPLTTPIGAGAPPLLVVGPPGSGRSTALVAAAASYLHLHPDAPVTVLAPRGGPLLNLAARAESCTVAVTPADREGAVASLLEGTDLGLLVIDDLGQVAADAAQFDALLRRVVDQGTPCAIAASAGDAQGSFEPWARRLNALRRRLLLQPTREDAFAVNAKLPTVPDWPPGRGVLVDAGSSTLVHIGLVESDSTSEAGSAALQGALRRGIEDEV